MKRSITQTRVFERELGALIKRRRLLKRDFEDFKSTLCKNPEEGDLIVGTGGVRKTRLKSPSKGKSGSFRVCYFYDSEREEIFLLLIYSKNEQENLSADEKRALKAFTDTIKGY